MDKVRSRLIRSSLILSVLATRLVIAQWSNDPNVNTPIAVTIGNQQIPTITNDALRGAIITWEDTRTTILPDIYAQRVNARGIIQWTVNGISISLGPTIKRFPRTATDGDGGAIITWIDSPPSETNWDIYAQRVDGSGTVRWISNGAPIATASRDQILGAMVSDNSSGAIITWHDERNLLTTGSDIYAQRITDSGVVLWSSDGVPVCAAPNNQQFPVITNDGFHGVIIAWQDFRNLTDYDIYAQRISSSGNTLWATNGVRLSTNPAHQREPKIISDGNGGAILTWADERVSGCRIYSQRIDSSGNRLWGTNGVEIAQSACSYSALVTDGANGAIVAWSSNTGIYAQRIDAGGILLWDSNGVVVSTQPVNYNTAIVSDDSGGAIVAWLDTRNDSTHNITDIYAQRVNASGVVMWQMNGVPITTAPGNQFNPTITTDGAGGAIITWTDWRTGTNADIYAQQVSANGTLGLVTLVQKEEPLPKDFVLLQNYPNPFNPSTIIEFEIPRSTFVRLLVVNVLGQEVATLVSRQLTPGRYREAFNAINFSSGVYLYKLLTSESAIVKKMLFLR